AGVPRLPVRAAVSREGHRHDGPEVTGRQLQRATPAGLAVPRRRRERMVAPDEAIAPVFTRYDIGISPFWQEASAAEQQRQADWQKEIAGRGEVSLGADVFV